MEMGGEISKICSRPSSNLYNYPKESSGRWKNLPGQLSGYWTLQEKEIHRILLNVANEGLFWNTSILFVNYVKHIFSITDLLKMHEIIFLPSSRFSYFANYYQNIRNNENIYCTFLLKACWNQITVRVFLLTY